MPSIGLALFEANKMYDDQKFLNEQHDAWRADAPLREAERARKIDEAQQYFSEGNKAERSYVDQQKKEVAENLTLLNDHRQDILQGPAGFAKFLTQVERLSDGSSYVADDKDGYANGLTVVRVDANGKEIEGTRRTISEIKDANTAFLATRAHVVGTKQRLDDLSAADAKRLEREHDLTKISKSGEEERLTQKQKDIAENARTAARIHAEKDLAEINGRNATQRIILEQTMRGSGEEVDKSSAFLAGFAGIDKEGNPFLTSPAGDKVYADPTNVEHRKMLESYQNNRTAIGTELANSMGKGLIINSAQANSLIQQRANDIRAANFMQQQREGVRMHNNSNRASATAPVEPVVEKPTTGGLPIPASQNIPTGLLGTPNAVSNARTRMAAPTGATDPTMYPGE